MNFVASAAPAAEAPSAVAAGTVLPAVLREVLPDALPGGAAQLRVWGFRIYDASLWVAPGFRAGGWARSPLALELRYLRETSGEAIAQRSLDEMRRAGPLAPAQADRWLHAMRLIFPDVRDGDRVLGLYQPDSGARFFLNGASIGQLRDPAFAERFFAIWLGPRSSEPALREALLAPLQR